MPTQRWGRVLVAEVHVTRASWQVVLDSWQQASQIVQTECTQSPELLVHRANQWGSMDVCDKAWGMWRHHELLPLSCGNCPHRGKGQDEREEEDIKTSSQRATRIVRCDRELHVFNSASGPIFRCREWNLAGTPCTLIKAGQEEAVVHGPQVEVQRMVLVTQELSGQDNGAQDPPPINDWTAQVRELAANPAWA